MRMKNKTDNLLNGSRERERRKTEKSFMPSLAHDDVCLRYDTYGPVAESVMMKSLFSVSLKWVLMEKVLLVARI